MPVHPLPAHFVAVQSATEAPAEGQTSATPPPEGPLVLTVDEAAELLRVNRKTLYASIEAHEVPGVIRLGRLIRIGRAALLAWAAGKAGPALGENQ